MALLALPAADDGGIGELHRWVVEAAFDDAFRGPDGM